MVAVKGQEVPMHDARVKTGLGLQYALSPNGADHWFAQHDPLFATEASSGVVDGSSLGIEAPVDPLDLGPAKVDLVWRTSLLNSLYDCLGVCIFGAYARSMTAVTTFADLVAAATGWDVGLPELLQAGERALAMSRLYNVRQGFGPQDDILPPLFLTPIPDGPLAGRHAIDPDAFAAALRLYYDMAVLGPGDRACRRPAGWPSSAWRGFSTLRCDWFSRHGLAAGSRRRRRRMRRAPARASRPGPAPVVVPAPDAAGVAAGAGVRWGRRYFVFPAAGFFSLTGLEPGRTAMLR